MKFRQPLTPEQTVIRRMTNSLPEGEDADAYVAQQLAEPDGIARLLARVLRNQREILQRMEKLHR